MFEIAQYNEIITEGNTVQYSVYAEQWLSQINYKHPYSQVILLADYTK